MKTLSRYIKLAGSRGGAEYIYLYNMKDKKWYYADTYKDTKLKKLSGKCATPSEIFFITRFRGCIRLFIKAFKGKYHLRIRDFLRSIFYSRYFLI